MTYKLAIFDMDGTTLDTLEDLYLGVNEVLRKNGMPTHTREEVRSYVGNGIRNLIRKSVPGDCDDIEKILQEYNAWYAVHCNDHTGPYEGILPLLEKLKENGIQCAIVSNKADFAVQTLCERYFQGLIGYGIGEKEGTARKPAPDMVNEALAHFHMNKEDAVYIGDSEVDIRTAENAGMDSIIVLWGFREKEYLKQQGAKVLCEDIAALEKLLIK